jgi:hypothetical protein
MGARTSRNHRIPSTRRTVCHHYNLYSLTCRTSPVRYLIHDEDDKPDRDDRAIGVFASLLTLLVHRCRRPYVAAPRRLRVGGRVMPIIVVAQRHGRNIRSCQRSAKFTGRIIKQVTCMSDPIPGISTNR